ncbi:cupin domain-containing protein [Aestuariivita sp.]|uniref:cupin domain-containing protein n=1 Tax=Aestuariivita sp. TaxID=1872407 RepID=UPI00216FC732|nr:cupin domain-containing protein [Aestuariivita sp.]MCE8006135.1 cupin domain-containing protein [Aestuariivita sp.]
MPAPPVEAEVFVVDAAANDNRAGSFAASRYVVHADDQPIEGGFGPQYGGVTWRTLICRDRMASSELVLGVAQIPAGGLLAAHRHPPAEFYFVLSGSGVVTIDGAAHPVIRSSTVYIPGNAEHSFAAGPDGVSFAYGFAMHAFGEVEYTFSEE